MSDDYLWDRSGAPDAEVAKLEELLAPLAHRAPLDELRMRRPRRRWPWIAGVLVAVAAAVALFLALPRGAGAGACSGGAGFAFEGVGGTVACGGQHVARGTLPVGGTLDTGAHAATLTIADIGTAELRAGTTLRLERTDSERHQLALDRGSMHAKVKARPRLFAVTTPHAEVVDLGCEYDISIDEHGAGELRVTNGLVELGTTSGGIVVVPEGCAGTIAGAGRPGLPRCASATPAVAEAIAAYDRGEHAAADAIIAAADRRDAIVLIALAAIDPAHAAAALARLAELSPPPDAEIDPETAARDPAQLAVWRTDVLEIYFGLWSPSATRR